MMLERHARYMPVMDQRTLMGVISFYDVAKAVVDSQDFENRMLKAYIRDWPVDEAGRSPPPTEPAGRPPRIAAWRQHLRRTLPRHQLRRIARAGDRLRDRRLPTGHGACRRPTSSPSSTAAAPAPAATSPSATRPTRWRSSPASTRQDHRHADLPADPQHRPAQQGLRQHRPDLPARPCRLHLLPEIRPARPARRRPLSARLTAPMVAPARWRRKWLNAAIRHPLHRLDDADRRHRDPFEGEAHPGKPFFAANAPSDIARPRGLHGRAAQGRRQLRRAPLRGGAQRRWAWASRCSTSSTPTSPTR